MVENNNFDHISVGDIFTDKSKKVNLWVNQLKFSR